MAARSRGEQGMVLVMGVTGAGKSYFINRLKDGSVVEGSTMDSCEFSSDSIFNVNSITIVSRHGSLRNCRDLHRRNGCCSR